MIELGAFRSGLAFDMYRKNTSRGIGNIEGTDGCFEISVDELDVAVSVLFTSLNFDVLAVSGGVTVSVDFFARGMFLIRRSDLTPVSAGVGGCGTAGATGLGSGAFFSFIPPPNLPLVDGLGGAATCSGFSSESSGVCETICSEGVVVVTGSEDGGGADGKGAPASEDATDELCVLVGGIKGRTGAPCPRAISALTRADGGGAA